MRPQQQRSIDVAAAVMIPDSPMPVRLVFGLAKTADGEFVDEVVDWILY